MLKEIILILGLALILSPGIPPHCQAVPGKDWSDKEVTRPTPPLIKITPRSGGKFLLEPLTAPPQGNSIPLPRPPRNKEKGGTPAPTSQKHTMITSWDISPSVLSKVRHARYVWGSSLETGSTTDCSGFTQFIYRLCKINLPRTSAEQSQMGKVVTREMDFSKLNPGDLLFFRQGGRAVGHADIYLGEGKMIHASSSGGGVTVTELERGYYINNFVVAKRVFETKYKWPSFPGLRPAARNRDWDFPVVTALPFPKPLSAVVPPMAMLLKIFWYWGNSSTFS